MSAAAVRNAGTGNMFSGTFRHGGLRPSCQNQLNNKIC